MKLSVQFTLALVSIVVLTMAIPASALDYPLTPEAIRDAYIYGTGPHRSESDFLADYTHAIPELKVTEQYYSTVHIETPYSQVAENVSGTDTAQDAVRKFSNMPMKFRILLAICYEPTQSKPVKVTVIQNGKQIVPLSENHSAYWPFQDPTTYVPSIGEHITLEYDPGKIDSSLLTIKIETPNGQRAKATFDFATLR